MLGVFLEEPKSKIDLGGAFHSVREARKIGSLGGLDTRTWPVFVTSYLLWTCYSIRIGDVWVCLASIFGSVTWLYFCLTAIRLTSQEEGELGPTCSSEPWEGGMVRRRAIDLHQCSKFYRKATIDKTEKGLAAGLGFTFCLAFACSPWNIEELNFLEAIITPEIKLSVFSSICGFSTLVLFINPLSRLWILVKRRDASTIFLPIVMAQLVQNLLWAAYGILALEPGLCVLSGFGVFVVVAQLLLKCVFRGADAAVEDPALEEEPELLMESLTPIPCGKPVTTFGRRHNTIDLPDVSNRLKAQRVYEDYLNSVREARKIGSLGGLDTRTWPVFVTSYLLWTCYSIRIGDVWVCLASIFGSVTWLYFCLTAIRLTSQEEGELGPTCSSEPWEGGMVRRRTIDLHQCSKFYRKATIDKTEKGLAAGLGFTFCVAFACSPWNIEELNFLEAIITPEIKLSVFSSICGFSTLLLFINPLSRLWILVKRRDASTIFLPIVMAQLVQNLLWATYGILALEPGLYVPSGFGVFVVLAQLLLKCVFRGAGAAVEDPALEEEPGLFMDSLTPIPCDKPVTTFGRRHNTIDLPDVSSRLKAQCVYEDYLKWQEANRKRRQGYTHSALGELTDVRYVKFGRAAISAALKSGLGHSSPRPEEGELRPTATIDKTEKGLAGCFGFTFCVAFACSPWNIAGFHFLEAIITPEIKLSVLSSTCGFSTLLMYINPFIRLWILVKRRDASAIFLPLVMAQLVQNLVWTAYGILALDPGLYRPYGKVALDPPELERNNWPRCGRAEPHKYDKERDSVFITYLDDENTECILNQESIFDALTERNHPIIHFRLYLSAEAEYRLRLVRDKARKLTLGIFFSGWDEEDAEDEALPEASGPRERAKTATTGTKVLPRSVAAATLASTDQRGTAVEEEHKRRYMGPVTGERAGCGPLASCRTVSSNEISLFRV
ncbi:unnamed protein product, partial [Polarella glacialis]